MSNESIWIDSSGERFSPSPTASAGFIKGYTDTKIDEHANKIPIDHIDCSVTTNALADQSVTTQKLADGAVTATKLADASVTSEKLSQSARQPYARTCSVVIAAADTPHKEGADYIVNNSTEYLDNVITELFSNTGFKDGTRIFIRMGSYLSSNGHDILSIEKPCVIECEASLADFTVVLNTDLAYLTAGAYNNIVINGSWCRITQCKCDELYACGSYNQIIGNSINRITFEQGADYNFTLGNRRSIDNQVTDYDTQNGVGNSIEAIDRTVWANDYIVGGGIYNALSLRYTKSETDSLLNAHKSAAVLDHPDGSVSTNKLADGAVTANKLAANSVTAAKLNNYCVTQDKLALAAVTEAALANSCVGSAKLQNACVTTVKLADSCVTTAKLNPGAVTEDKLCDGAVTQNKLADQSITPAKLASQVKNSYSRTAAFIIASTDSINKDGADYIVTNTTGNYLPNILTAIFTRGDWKDYSKIIIRHGYYRIPTAINITKTCILEYEAPRAITSSFNNNIAISASNVIMRNIFCDSITVNANANYATIYDCYCIFDILVSGSNAMVFNSHSDEKIRINGDKCRILNSTVWEEIVVTGNTNYLFGNHDINGAIPIYTNTGLGNVIETAKTATFALNFSAGGSIESALNGRILNSQRGAANGIMPLDANAKAPLTYLPDAILGALKYQGTYDAGSGVYPSNPSKGYYYIVSVAGVISGVDYEIGDWLVYGTSWSKVDNSDKVSSVNGRVGVITLTCADVALDNVINAKQATEADVGLIANLTTGIKTSIVNAINWIANKLGVAGGIATLDANTILIEPASKLKYASIEQPYFRVEATLGADAGVFTVSDLDLNTHKQYIIEFTLKSSSATTNTRMRINNITSNTDYHSAVSWSGSAVNDCAIVHLNPGLGGYTTGRVELRKTIDNKIIYSCRGSVRNSSNNFVSGGIEQADITVIADVANVTSISFVGAIAAGSMIKVRSI